MSRWRVMWHGAWPTLAVVGISYLIFWMLGANWPNDWMLPRTPIAPDRVIALRDHRINLIGIHDMILFTLAACFLSIKSTIMIQRMGPRVDWLTVALVVVNMSFANLYMMVVIAALFPYWFATNMEAAYWITNLLRYTLLAAILWGGWQLLSIPPPDYEDDDAYHNRQATRTYAPDR